MKVTGPELLIGIGFALMAVGLFVGLKLRWYGSGMVLCYLAAAFCFAGSVMAASRI